MNIGQKVSWEKRISPFYPSSFNGVISNIIPSKRFDGENIITISTKIGNIILSSLDEEFEFLSME